MGRGGGDQRGCCIYLCSVRARGPARCRAASLATGAGASPRGAGYSKKSAGVLHSPPAVKYAFVVEHTVQFAVRTMCRVLAISRSGYYEWLSRGPSRRVQQDAGLIQAIYRVHLASGRAYGALKTWRTLQAQGIRCGKHRVARLRKAVGIETQRSRRFRQRRTYTSCLPEPNLLQGCFNVAAPNRVWAGDISYIRTGTGALNLAVLIDLYSRRVVGWSLSPNPDERLVSAALAMALRQRQPHPGLVHHTDQGAVYRA